MGTEIRLLVLMSRLKVSAEVKERIIILLNQKIDWSYFLYQCMKNKICNIVICNVMNLGIENYFDYTVLKALRYYYNYSKRRLSYLEDRMVEITNELNEKQISYALIKGFDIVNKVYNPITPFSRDFNDIDILLDKDDLSRVSLILQQMGYVQGDVDNMQSTVKEASRIEQLEMMMRSHQIYSYVRIDTIDKELEINESALVDVNFTPFEGGNVPPKIATKTMLEECKKIPLYEGYYSSLNMYYTFIQLVYHLYKDTSYKRKKDLGIDLTIQKFCDIREYLLYAQNEWDWEYLIKLVLDNKLSESVYFVVYFTQKMYEENNYDNFLKRICPENEQFLSALYEFETYYEGYFK